MLQSVLLHATLANVAAGIFFDMVVPSDASPRIGRLDASTSISEMLDKGRPEQILPSDATWPPYPSTLPTAACFQTQQQKLISFLVALMFARRSRSLLPHRLAPPPGCLRSSPAGCGWLARPARRRPQSAGPAPYRPSYSEPRAAARAA